MWAASVMEVAKTNGRAQVTVRYTDGAASFVEVYQNSTPGADWIPQAVRVRLAQLGMVDGYAVATGPVVPAAEPPVDENVILFRRRCRALETAKILIDMGAVPANHPKVTALVNYITSHVDYIDTL